MQVVHKQTVQLEKKQRLSKSMLWQLQRNYFERQGIGAWSTGTVPHHITSSPYIADAYVRIVTGYLRDCLSVAPIDQSQPLYIVELGCGSGRFAYLFLKKFLDRLRDSVLKDVRIKYVMTDFAEQNLEHCRAHPWLQTFIKDGLLDFARFDVERDREFKLTHSGEKISSDSSGNPLVVIANYVFDGVPQDAFFVSKGRLLETLVTLNTAEGEKELNDPETFSGIELLYDCNQVNGNYYKDANWNRILLDYKRRLPETSFLFPTAALQCIQNLQQLSRGRLLLLSGDRGYSSDEALLSGKGIPAMSLHGSFSMMVDYQIIGEYCRQLGGDALHPGRNAESLNISAFIFGDSRRGFVETRQTYAEAIEKFGPDDFFTLKEGIAQVYETLSLSQILAFLRLSCWDYKRFGECLPVLKQRLTDISDIQKLQLREAIVKVWDSYLPIGEESDLAFELGTFLLELEFHAEALEFLQRSVELYGIAPGSAYNMAVCYYSMGQLDHALDYVNQALGLDQKFAAARNLRRDLESALSNRTRRQRRKRA